MRGIEPCLVGEGAAEAEGRREGAPDVSLDASGKPWRHGLGLPVPHKFPLDSLHHEFS